MVASALAEQRSGEVPHGQALKPFLVYKDRARFGDAYRGMAEAETFRIVVKMLVHQTVDFERRALEIPY